MRTNNTYRTLLWLFTLSLFLVMGCNREESNLKTIYKEEIREAIQEANKEISTKDATAKNAKLTSTNVRADIYNDGQFVRLTYKNAKGHWEQSAFERLKNGHYKAEDPHRFSGKQPTYTENKHIGKNEKHLHKESK
ncbi:hypothetical protein [Priestia aryabhattai]|uniref:hypothetical protein n=1 Tax=Priestia aryabhattai TaxID=412384 RepID=UPI0024530EFA|nr:hypothetical protein [Priestia aryabhattai]MDH3111074.1 hypothetical protein [Priestia aryabhattai]MDH3129743.1 hypothetical protein [Priestia aryabhattai]